MLGVLALSRVMGAYQFRELNMLTVGPMENDSKEKGLRVASPYHKKRHSFQGATGTVGYNCFCRENLMEGL